MFTGEREGDAPFLEVRDCPQSVFQSLVKDACRTGSDKERQSRPRKSSANAGRIWRKGHGMLMWASSNLREGNAYL